jgi:hypothetical protein
VQIPFVRPPRCPISPPARSWLDRRLEWLAGTLGPGILSGRRLVLPTPEFFPFPYDGSDLSVARMFRAVSRFMDLDPDRVRVVIVEDHQQFWPVDENGYAVPLEPGGELEMTADGPVVSVNRSELDRPEAVAGTFAHELAHLRLFDAGTTDSDEFDAELLTDLAAVHLGLGIFIANDPRAWPSQVDRWPGTEYPRPRYMTADMTAHALAIAALCCGTPRPDWRRHLNSDAAVNLKASVRYLRSTRDSAHLAMPRRGSCRGHR